MLETERRWELRNIGVCETLGTMRDFRNWKTLETLERDAGKTFRDRHSIRPESTGVRCNFHHLTALNRLTRRSRSHSPNGDRAGRFDLKFKLLTKTFLTQLFLS